MIIASHQLILNQVDAKYNWLDGVLPASIRDRFIPNLDIIRTEWSHVEVFMKLMLTQIVVFAVCIKRSHKQVLGHILILTLVDNCGFQKVNQRVCNLRNLHLDNFKVFRYDIPNIFITIFVPVIYISPNTFV